MHKEIDYIQVIVAVQYAGGLVRWKEAFVS